MVYNRVNKSQYTSGCWLGVVTQPGMVAWWVWLHRQEWLLGGCGYTARNGCLVGVVIYVVTIWQVWLYIDRKVGVVITDYMNIWWVWLYIDCKVGVVIQRPYTYGGCGYTVSA